MFLESRLCSVLDIELGLLKFMLILQVSVFRLLLLGGFRLASPLPFEVGGVASAGFDGELLQEAAALADCAHDWCMGFAHLPVRGADQADRAIDAKACWDYSSDPPLPREVRQGELKGYCRVLRVLTVHIHRFLIRSTKDCSMTTPMTTLPQSKHPPMPDGAAACRRRRHRWHIFVGSWPWSVCDL